MRLSDRTALAPMDWENTALIDAYVGSDLEDDDLFEDEEDWADEWADEDWDDWDEDVPPINWDEEEEEWV